MSLPLWSVELPHMVRAEQHACLQLLHMKNRGRLILVHGHEAVRRNSTTGEGNEITAYVILVDVLCLRDDGMCGGCPAPNHRRSVRRNRRSTEDRPDIPGAVTRAARGHVRG